MRHKNRKKQTLCKVYFLEDFGITIRLLEEVVQANAADDAAHIAIAAVHGIDFLLTWNCKHINNRYTTRKIEECCQKMGFTCPVIATPTELMEIEL